MTNLVGMHDEEGAHVAPGWCLVTVEAFHPGRDFHHLVKPIVRLNNGYHPNGTIPQAQDYPRFAQACGEYVRTSKGCRHWIIGNEPNLAHERPQGHPISAQSYVACFNLCRDAIKRVQPDAVVIPAPVGPWNVETGDWLVYQQILWAAECDGLAIHTYGSHEKAYMQPPYERRKYGFWAYQDFMDVVPQDKKHLPVFITECNPNHPWDAPWMEQAADEINRWNQTGQPIHCLLPYCYINRDQFGFRDKGHVLDDIRRAYAKNYSVPEQTMAFAPGKWPHFTKEGFVEYVRNLKWLDPKPHRLFLHHTWRPTPETWQGMRTMDAMHRVYRQQVWYDAQGNRHVGWTVFPHIFVAEDGIWLMNDLRKDGAGVTGHNKGAIHCELVWNGDEAVPSGATWENAKVVLRTLLETLDIPALEFHRDYAAKTCPGTKVTKEWVNAQILPPAGDLPEHETSTDAVVLSDKVRWWLEEEQRMREAGNDTRADAIRLSLIKLLYRLTDLLRA